jgi:hypothetical protein
LKECNKRRRSHVAAVVFFVIKINGEAVVENKELYEIAQIVKNQVAETIRRIEANPPLAFARVPERMIHALMLQRLRETHEIASEAMSIGKHGNIHAAWLEQMIYEAREDELKKTSHSWRG